MPIDSVWAACMFVRELAYNKLGPLAGMNKIQVFRADIHCLIEYSKFPLM
jgi:hypothetical protein